MLQKYLKKKALTPGLKRVRKNFCPKALSAPNAEVFIFSRKKTLWMSGLIQGLHGVPLLKKERMN